MWKTSLEASPCHFILSSFILKRCQSLLFGERRKVDWIPVFCGLVFEIEVRAHKPKDRTQYNGTAHARERKNNKISLSQQ